MRLSAFTVSAFLTFVLAVLLPFGTAAAQDRPVTSNDPTAALPPPPEDSAPLDASRPGEAAASDQPLGVSFQSATFVGAKAVDEATLRPAWQDMVGRNLTVADVRTIARRAEQIYSRAGYPFVVVVVQPQDLSDGVIEFVVVEGRISDLTVVGADPVARRQAAGAFQGLIDREPLPGEDLERSYELARTLPGLSIAGALRRGTKPGGMDLVVQTRRRSWRAYVNVNNLFSDPVGPWGALVGADIFGGSSYGDVTSIQLYSTFDTEEQQVLRLSHSRRINADGTTLSASYLLAEANPQGVVAPLDLATDVQAFRFEAAHPWILRPEYSLWGSAGFEWSDQETAVFGNITISEDKTRVATVRANGEWRGDNHTSRYYLEARKGLDIGDASQRGDPLNSRFEGNPEAFVVRGSVEGELKIADRWKVYGRVDGQWTEDPLLAPEEYSIGNLTIGRGYEPGSALGDRAAAVSVEARWGPYPFQNGMFRASPFVFYDGVKYWNEDSFGVRERSIASAGAGLRLDMPGRGRLDVTWAKPLNPPMGFGEKTPGSTVLVNFTATWDDMAEGLWRLARKGAPQ